MKEHLLSFLFASLIVTSLEAADKAKPEFPLPEQVSVKEMPAGVYEVDPIHNMLLWKVRHMELMSYIGSFDKVRGTLDLNPEDPLKSKIEIMIDPKSVRTGFNVNKMDVNEKYHARDWDKELAGEKWFNTEKHPEIKFVSTKIEKTGQNKGILHGDLTFLGVTKPVKLDVVFNGAILKKPFDERALLGFSANGKLKRSDFGLSFFTPMIGDEVELIVEIEFLKKVSK